MLLDPLLRVLHTIYFVITVLGVPLAHSVFASTHSVHQRHRHLLCFGIIGLNPPMYQNGDETMMDFITFHKHNT